MRLTRRPWGLLLLAYLLPAVARAESAPAATGDGDFAAAIAADAAASEKPAASPASTAAPVAGPMPKLNPNISLILDAGAGWFDRGDHFRQMGHAVSDNGIALQGVELAASANVDPYFRFDLAYQLRDAEIEEAYLTTLSLPLSLQVRVGKMSALFGRENAQHTHTWKFANPPLSHTRFMSPEHFRGVGAEASVILPLPWYSTLLVEALTSSEQTGFESASFGTVDASGTGHVRSAADMTYVARAEEFFALTDDFSLLLGASGATGLSAFDPTGRTNLFGGDLYFKWRPISSGEGDFALSLTVEYLVRDAAIVGAARLRDHGGYAELVAQLSRYWEMGLRADSTATVFGHLPIDAEMPAWQRRGSLSLTYLPTHFSKIRLQADSGVDAARNQLGYAVFLQAEVSAGEHGAHKF